MLAAGPCWIPPAGFARVLFAFHRLTPLAPAISVLTGADKGIVARAGTRTRAKCSGKVGRRLDGKKYQILQNHSLTSIVGPQEVGRRFGIDLFSYTGQAT